MLTYKPLFVNGIHILRMLYKIPRRIFFDSSNGILGGDTGDGKLNFNKLFFICIGVTNGDTDGKALGRIASLAETLGMGN